MNLLVNVSQFEWLDLRNARELALSKGPKAWSRREKISKFESTGLLENFDFKYLKKMHALRAIVVIFSFNVRTYVL